MAAYIVATVQISDPDSFGVYARGIAGLSEKFGGESLLKGAVIDVIEGDAAVGERVVVSRYPDEASARAYLASPEYVAASKHRIGAAKTTVRILVD